MLCYTIRLEEDDGTLLVTSPDFPELTTFGEDHDEALVRAVDALEEAIAARIHDRRDIPMPSPGDICVQLPTLTAVKVILYQGMRDQNIGKAELARRLGWHLPQVDRVLNVNHHSRLDQMDAALGAIGLRIEVTSVAA
jgi:antitoxin HicB